MLLAKERAWTPAPRDLWEPVSAQVLTSQFPSRPTSAKAALGGPERPQPLEKPRDAEPAGTHPTATRRQRRAGRTMSASQAAANRPSGEPGPGGAGPGSSELHSERSAELGSCGSSKKTQPTASARKPAYAEPRHSAIGTRRRILSQPAPLPGLARADVDTRVTSCRRATATRRGVATGVGRGEKPSFWVPMLAFYGGAVHQPRSGLDKGGSAGLGAAPLPGIPIIP